MITSSFWDQRDRAPVWTPSPRERGIFKIPIGKRRDTTSFGSEPQVMSRFGRMSAYVIITLLYNDSIIIIKTYVHYSEVATGKTGRV